MWAAIGPVGVSGVEGKLAFEDGELTGTPEALAEAEEYAAYFGYVGVTPTGPWVDADLTDESSAFLVALTVLRHLTIVAGEVPPLPEVGDERGENSAE